MQEEQGGKKLTDGRGKHREVLRIRGILHKKRRVFISLFFSLSYDFMRSNLDITCHVNQQLKHQIKNQETPCFLHQFRKFRWILHEYFVLRCFKQLDR